MASITSEVGIGGDTRSSICAIERANGRFKLVKDATTVSYGAAGGRPAGHLPARR